MIKPIIYTILICLAYVVIHEATHYSIFLIYDCENITFGLGDRGIYTKAYCSDDNVKLPTAIHEIIGYNVVPLLIILIVLILKGR